VTSTSRIGAREAPRGLERHTGVDPATSRGFIKVSVCVVIVLSIACLYSAVLVSPPLNTAAAASTSADVILYSEDFEDGLAQGWNLPAGWAVAADPAGGSSLRCRGPAYCQYGGDSWGDFAYTVRIKPISGRIHLYYCIGGGTYYFIGFEEHALDLTKASADGRERTLKSVAQERRANRWYELRIVEADGRVDVYVDGTRRLSYADPDPLLYGGIALEVPGTSEYYVDDVLITGHPITAAGLQWVKTGGPAGGIGYDVRIDPGDPKSIVVTDAWSGMHKSTDGGESWQAINSGITTRTGPSGDAIPIFCASLDPSDSQVIWAGTLSANGVYCSRDGGSTWMLLVNGISDFPSDHTPTYRCFAVNPSDSDTVLVALELAQPGTEKRYGQIYKTVDGGQRWRKVLQAGALFRRIEFDPANSNVVYAGTGIFDRWPQRPEGIFKSTDGGETWAQINEGLTNLTAPYLALDPRDPRTLYAAAGGEPSFGGVEHGAVFKTVDGGAHWKKVLDPDPNGWAVFGAVAVAPSSPDIIYAAREEAVFRSANAGLTWANLGYSGDGYRMGFPVALAVDPVDPNVVYINSYEGGILKSIDGGRNWRCASAGYTGSQVAELCIDPQSPASLFAATANGVFYSPDGGASYQGLNGNDNTLEFARTVAVGPATGWLYAANSWRGLVHVSTDRGAHWSILSGALSPRVEELRAVPLTVGVTAILPPVPGSNAVMVATLVGRESDFAQLSQREGDALGILVSGAGGGSWQPLNQGLPSKQVYCIARHPTAPLTLYAATLRGFARSIDGGTRWDVIGPRTVSGIPRAVAVDPSGGAIYLAATGSISRSLDAGKTWQILPTRIDPNAEVRAIAISPADDKLIAIAEVRTGVYMSWDRGDTWTKVTQGLHTRAVNDLLFSADGRTLYAATEGEGVFRLVLSFTGG
jgi:photosystem II stability/assembly factor-like uncharacterized protein